MKKKVLCVAAIYSVNHLIWKIFKALADTLKDEYEFKYLCSPNKYVPEKSRLPENTENVLNDIDLVLVWNGQWENELGGLLIKEAERKLIPTFYLERGLLPQEYANDDWTFYISPKGIEYNTEATDWELEKLTVKEEKILEEQLKSLKLKSGKGDNILLALQIDSDDRITMQSPYFKEMQRVIDFVCSQVSETVVLRKHPLDTNEYVLPQNAVWDKNKDLKSSIKECKFLITVNSSCGLQALAIGKPVILLGNSIYEQIAYKYTGDNFVSLLVGANAGLSKEQKQKINNYLYRFLTKFQWLTSELTKNKEKIKTLIALPFISVILAVYNQAQYIKESIDSLLNQEYQNYELIVVDDGSTDNLMEVLNKYNDLRVKIIRIPHKGLSYARNLGVFNAKSDIIIFQDADDIITKEKLKAVAYYTNKYPNIGVFYGSYFVCDKDLNVQHTVYSQEYSFEVQLNQRPSIFPGGDGVIRKSVFFKVGMFDTEFDLVCDLDWIARAFSQGIPVMNLHTVFSFYRRYGGSIGEQNRDKQLDQENIVFKRIKQGYMSKSFTKQITTKLSSFKHKSLNGALLTVWKKRKDLQKAFPNFPKDMNFKYMGKMTILDWAKLYGKNEESSLEEYFNG